MKKFMLVALLLTSCSAALADKNEAPIQGEISSFAISSDSDKVALVTSRPYTLWVVDHRGKRRMRLAGVESVMDVMPEVRVSWSHDAKYVAIQYAASEDTSLVEVLNADTLVIVWTSTVTNAQWLKDGHLLVVVPNYGLDELQNNYGLVRYDPESKHKQVIAKTFLFAGPLKAGRKHVLAKVMQYKAGHPVFSLLRVDVETGETKPVP